jgi:hypothetical protein
MPKTDSGAAGKTKGLKRRVLYVSLPDRADRICSACETCPLMRSLQHAGAFDPKKSHIKVVPRSMEITMSNPTESQTRAGKAGLF